MIPVVSFIGRSNSGKTTLLEQVVCMLKTEGFRVGVIKHSPHGFDIDREGKDTWRFSQAGADMIAVASPERVAILEKVTAEPGLDDLVGLFEDKVDILITEGYKSSETPKIVVLGVDKEIGKLGYHGETLFVVSSQLSPSGVPEFNSSDIREIIAIIKKQIHETRRSIVCVI
ncbi:MAG: molybdopterin-guanine dinucleotide biosynthesis protein B [Chloroflexi bacterium]|nr:molybdopterin-guanine dinucleotide biosynthesis protein B [Chloroflexota bacterium]